MQILKQAGEGGALSVKQRLLKVEDPVKQGVRAPEWGTSPTHLRHAHHVLSATLCECSVMRARGPMLLLRPSQRSSLYKMTVVRKDSLALLTCGTLLGLAAMW